MFSNLEQFAQDLRYAVRALQKNIGFTTIAVLTLAIGIGANTAVFTMYNAVALRPMQTPEAERLVQITQSDRAKTFTYSGYTYYRDHNQSFSGLAAVATRTFALGGIGESASEATKGIATSMGFQIPHAISQQAGVAGVSGNYFRVLGVSAALGRTFRPEDDTFSAEPVALISDHFWEQRFARNQSALGRSLTLNGVSITIVGITPPDFSGTEPAVPDLWIPLALQSHLSGAVDLAQELSLCCRIYGRLPRGVPRARAEAEMNALATALRLSGNNERSAAPSARIVLTPASPFGPEFSESVAPAILLLGAVSTILLIACANVASLLLARSSSRQKEIAVRLAIGASRRRLVRQLLTESGVLSVLAGSTGLLLSWWLLHFAAAQLPTFLPSYQSSLAFHIAPDYRVLAYSLFLTIAATFAFGLAPALEASKVNLGSALKDEGTAFGSRLRKSRLRDLMIITQVAVCLMLLIVAGLLARASERSLASDLGYEYHNIISLDISYPRTASPSAVAALRAQITQQVEALPEIQSVAVASLMPLKGSIRVINVAPNGGALNVPGTQNSHVTLVTPNYFETMEIPILLGRGFNTQEARDGSGFDDSPVIVSEAAARRYWPGENPLGKQIAFGACLDCRILPAGEEYAHSTSSTVVGVAKDVQGRNLDNMNGTLVYLPVTTASWGDIVMRARGNEGNAVASIDRLFRTTHGDLETTIWDSRTVRANQNGFVVSRVGAIGAAIIGILGLLMASVGIYGTVGFAVIQRTPEIGIRMALGAQRREILGLVLFETMRPVAMGLAAGIAGAAVVSHLMRSVLFGLNPLDPLAFVAVTGFLAAVALLAGYLPARHATKVDPLIALRYD